MSLKSTVEHMKQISVRDCLREQLTDLSVIEIDERKPKEERMLDYLRQVKNPYCFRVGDVAVGLVFDGGGRSFEQCLLELLEANISREDF